MKKTHKDTIEQLSILIRRQIKREKERVKSYIYCLYGLSLRQVLLAGSCSDERWGKGEGVTIKKKDLVKYIEAVPEELFSKAFYFEFWPLETGKVFLHYNGEIANKYKFREHTKTLLVAGMKVEDLPLKILMEKGLKIKIIFWPDGTWCYQEELENIAWKFDDYSVTFVSEGLGPEAISRFVDGKLKGGNLK